MISNKAVTTGLIAGITIAIIMSSAVLVMFVNLNQKIDLISSHEKYENLEIGAPGISKNEFYIFTQELNADEEKIGVL